MSIKKAYGECGRSGKRVPLADMVEDGYIPGLLVARDWYEPPHPQDQEPVDHAEEHTVPAPEISAPSGEGSPAPALVFDSNGNLVFQSLEEDDETDVDNELVIWI